jgi:hypothetical protein
LLSETFDNDAVNASARFYADERPVENGAAGSGRLTIAYDATSKSYTVSTAGRSATFAQADLVVSGSADFVSFQKLGATSEALTLTKPGTSGALSYKYVGGGAWERATVSGDQLDFSYDPFTYGAETADAALVRTGTGFYSVSLVGARAMEAPYAMAGSGEMQVDFGSGSLNSSGVLTSIDVDTGLIKSIGVFFGEAQLSTTANAFSGGFYLEDGKRFTGAWAGRFYGPGAEEVGATWSLASADGEVAAGYMVGRQDNAISGINATMTQLRFDQTFEHRFSQLGFTDIGGGKSAATPPDLLRSDAQISYNAASNSFSYLDSGRGIDMQFGAGDLVANESTSSLSVYKITGTDGLDYKLTLNKAGAGNPSITLSYASFGRWERAQSAGNDRLDRWFTWGIRTNGFQIPSGTGTYSAQLMGSAATHGGGATYSLTGSSSFTMDFGAGTFTGSLNPIGKNLADGTTRDFGTFNFNRGAIDIDAGLNADIVNGNNAYLGFFEGALYGPTGSEVAGTFGMQTTNTDNGTATPASTVYMNGAIVGTRN